MSLLDKQKKEQPLFNKMIPDIHAIFQMLGVEHHIREGEVQYF